MFHSSEILLQWNKIICTGCKRFHCEAATVGLCDFQGQPLRKWTIYHPEGSFKTNRATIAVNGFKPDSLIHGQQKDEVVREITSFLNEKLVILCGGESDFVSLGLSTSQFNTFDLQQYWFETKFNSDGVEIDQPIGLKHIYFHYFGKKLQIGVHDAMEDAIATMKVFREVYVKLNDNFEPNPQNAPFSDFPRIL